MDGYANKYADGTGQAMNRYLYGDRDGRWTSDARIAGQIALMDSALRSSRLVAPSTLFRGLKGPVVQNITSTWTPGTVVTFPSYLSTSFMPLQALLYGGGGCILKLEIPPGAEIHAAYSPREDEIVLPRGLSWVVERVCTGLGVPPQVAGHPVHGDHRQAIDRSVRMIVLTSIHDRGRVRGRKKS